MKDWIAVEDGLGIRNRLSSSALATPIPKREAAHRPFNHVSSMPMAPSLFLVCRCSPRARATIGGVSSVTTGRRGMAAPQIQTIEPGAGRTVLVVVAHADDPALFLGGTLA